MSLLCVDIGTSNFKAGLFDGPHCTTAGVPLHFDEKRGRIESRQWLEAFAAALWQLEAGGADLRGLEALVVSGNGPNLVPVREAAPEGEAGVPPEYFPASLYLDRSAVREAETISRLCGTNIDPSFFLPKALAFKDAELEAYTRATHFLYTPEFLAWALTGRANTVLPGGTNGGLERWYWNDELLCKAGLDRAKFPAFINVGAEEGRVTKAAAGQFGLKSGLPVFAGGPDFFAAILGAGVTRPGQCCDRSGSSEGLNVCSGSFVGNSRLMCYRHPVEEWWNVSGIISTTGKALAWLKELLGLEALPWDSFYKLAEEEAGNVLFLPYLEGERAPIWDPAARGLFMGLSLDTDRGALVRSCAEGVCFALRDVLDVIKAGNVSIEEIRVTGGPAASGFLNQLKADICGLPLIRCTYKGQPCPAELRGDAIIGLTALGKYSNYTQAAEELIRPETVYHPMTDRGERRERCSRYEKLFTIYKDCYKALKNEFKKLNGEM
jgi:xylulokinase